MSSHPVCFVLHAGGIQIEDGWGRCGRQRDTGGSQADLRHEDEGARGQRGASMHGHTRPANV